MFSNSNETGKKIQKDRNEFKKFVHTSRRRRTFKKTVLLKFRLTEAANFGFIAEDFMHNKIY